MRTSYNLLPWHSSSSAPQGPGDLKYLASLPVQKTSGETQMLDSSPTTQSGSIRGKEMDGTVILVQKQGQGLSRTA